MSDVLRPPFSGDYSRNLHREAKRYLGVLQRQDKPLIDADLIDGSQIDTYQLMRALQSAFPSQAVGAAFQITQHPDVNNRANNFFVLAQDVDGNPSSMVNPDSYARMFVRGLPCIIPDSDNNGGVSYNTGNIQEDVLSAIFHHSSGLTDGVLTDLNARYVPGSLVGQQVVPNVADGSAFTITGNTETTIEVETGGLVAVATAGDFYRVLPITSTGAARTDLVWLDVYIGEANASEDAELLHPLAGGLESSRRLVLRQQIRYEQGTTILPFGTEDTQDRVYQDGNGVVHYATKLASITRADGVADISTADITDLRDPNFGSSREVAAARRGFATLFDSIEAADAGIGTRFSAQPAQVSADVGTAFTNVVQVTGAAYVGEDAGDDISEAAKLFEQTGRYYLKANPPSVISSRTDYTTVGTSQLKFFIDDDPTEYTIAFASPPDLTTPSTGIVDVINAFAATNNIPLVAAVMQSRYLALYSTTSDRKGRLNILQAGGAQALLFLPGDIARYADEANPTNMLVDTTREPKLREVGASTDPDVTVDLTGNPAGSPPGYVDGAHFAFDGVFRNNVVVRYGVSSSFQDEPMDAYLRRAAWAGLSDQDARVELEHYTDGQHRDIFLKSRHVDWGFGTDQISAADIPLTATGDLADAGIENLEDAVDALEANRLSRTGSASRRTMVADLLFSNGARATGLPTPLGDSDAATKGYVDANLTGIIILDPVRAATVANETIGDLIIGYAVDGVTLALDDRVLVKDQSTISENGVYVITAGAPVRSTELANATTTTGSYVLVLEGSTFEGVQFVMHTAGNPSIGNPGGEDDNEWRQFSSATAVKDGVGLAYTGLVLDVILEHSVGLGVSVAGLALDTAAIAGGVNSGLESLGTELLSVKLVSGGGIEAVAGGLQLTGADEVPAAFAGTAYLDATTNVFDALIALDGANSGNFVYTPNDYADWPSITSPTTATVFEALDFLADERSLKTHDHTGDEPQIPTDGIADEAVTGIKTGLALSQNGVDPIWGMQRAMAGRIWNPNTDAHIGAPWVAAPTTVIGAGAFPTTSYHGLHYKNLTINGSSQVVIGSQFHYYHIYVHGDLIVDGANLEIFANYGNDFPHMINPSRGSNSSTSSSPAGGGGGGAGFYANGGNGSRGTNGSIYTGASGGLRGRTYQANSPWGGTSPGMYVREGWRRQLMGDTQALLEIAGMNGGGGQNGAAGGNESGGQASTAPAGYGGGQILLFVMGQAIFKNGGSIRVRGGNATKANGAGYNGGPGGGSAGWVHLYAHRGVDTTLQGANPILYANGGDGGDGQRATGLAGGGGGGGGGGGQISVVSPVVMSTLSTVVSGGIGGDVSRGAVPGLKGGNGNNGQYRQIELDMTLWRN